MILDKIDQLLKEVSQALCQERRRHRATWLKYLSKKGEINAVMADFRNVAADQKKAVGIKINELKKAAQDKINSLREQVASADTGDNHEDLTRTPYPIAL